MRGRMRGLRQASGGGYVAIENLALEVGLNAAGIINDGADARPSGRRAEDESPWMRGGGIRTQTKTNNNNPDKEDTLHE